MDLCMRLLVTSLLAVSAMAQQVWVVDQLNRPGANFTDLPAAYAAAAPGDVLLLRSTGTTWAPYTPPPLIDRGMKILGERATPPPIIVGNVSVRNLPAADTLVLAGLSLPQAGWPSIGAQDNAGSIVLERCQVGERSCQGAGANLAFARCALVTFSQCQLFCCGVVLRFEDCLLHANDTEFREGRDVLGGGIANQFTLSLVRSTAHLANCYVQGGYELPTFPWQSPTWGSAISMCNSIIYISGSSRIWGGGGGLGAGIVSWFSSTCSQWLPGYFSPIVHRDPTTSLVGGIDPLADDRPGPVTAMTVTAIGSSSVTLTQHCRPSSLTLLAGALLAPTPMPSLPFDILLDPTTLFVIDLQAGNTSGLLSRTLPVPAAVPLGTMLGVQALELTASGTLLASNVMAVGSL